MLKLPISGFTVPFDGSFELAKCSNKPEKDLGKKHYKKELSKVIKEISELQRILYAHDKHSLLLVFQAMDAAGKDSTIRAVMSGIDPSGCQVFSFKRPSSQELDHDFLWRSAKCLPERGRIGIFNRSYYEEVLVVRVHPQILNNQRIPELPEKNWKFELGDIKERKHWDRYMQCYEDTLNKTSKEYAPWYCIPADNKPYMRLQVAQTVLDTLKTLKLNYPDVDPDERAAFAETRTHLEQDI